MSDSNSIDYIDHIAVVKKIDLNTSQLTVEISETSECEGCAAMRICNPAGGKRSELTVNVADPIKFNVGEKVILRGAERLHQKAIMIATVIPSIALILVMVGVWLLTGSEGMAALCGIFSMIVFFLLIYLCRNKLAHEFSFEVIPLI